MNFRRHCVQTPSTPVLLLVVKLVLKGDAQDPGADETTRKAVFLEALRLATSHFKYPRQVRKNLGAMGLWETLAKSHRTISKNSISD
ncbi:hypothetical protein MGG_16037 [Pyricularia oryzae 70-15]|uniref:Uncharacterized protein n=1 Tax=Pyricularia oryzae (strain 70-15 / ATCC MYA-4617 / FGSC 8958) TaxID=242507 RepID=G4MNT0_PYRO7|nr:uncharacterized protein MGG_16037 [Pyricularia oryzae 70-15]EHA56296.1 hypothetical protein MGG_16037 [Pyricularia oryzae 70-15]